MSFFGVEPILSLVETTPLSGGATYTSSWFASIRSMLLIQTFSDVAGTLFVDFSVDGTNADSTFPVSGYPCSASIPTVEPAAIGARYYRIRYVNGASAQTVFRLGVSECDISNFYSPLNNPYSLNSPATLTRTSWTWLDVARGLAGGVESVKKFGRAVVGVTPTPICFGGVYQTPQSGSGTTLRIAAGNAADSPAGIGARSVTVVGIEDVTFLEAQETLTTNGAAAGAAGSIVFSRVYRSWVASSGTYATATAQSHVGNIVIENSGGGTTWATIDSAAIALGQSEIGAFTVPAGKTAFVKMRHVTVDTGKTINLYYFFRENADQTAAPYSAMRAQSVLTGVTGGEIQPFGNAEVPFGPFVGPCDMGFLGNVTVGTATISIEFEIFTVDQ